MTPGSTGRAILAISFAFIMMQVGVIPAADEPSNRTQVPFRSHPVEKVDIPWYERSAMDQNKNGLADSLEDNPLPLNHVIVSFKSSVTDGDRLLISQHGGIPRSTISAIDAVTVESIPLGSMSDLASHPRVAMVEPIGKLEYCSEFATPNMKARESAEYSPNTAWDLGYQGCGISVAVVDTGADDEHPGLAGKFLGGADISKPETALKPWDGSDNPDDVNGHGTTCSGICMGTGAPEGRYMGAAPEARLVDVRIGTKIGYAPGEMLQSFKDATLEGIQWVIDHKDDNWGAADYDGIDMISLSWGIDVGGSSDGSDAYSRILDKAVDAGVIVVNAAGNDGPDNDGFSGCAAAALSIVVAASDELDTIDRDDDIIAFYSSRGPRADDSDGDPWNELRPDVAAPGTNIVQCAPMTSYTLLGMRDASGNGYESRGSGTSYATPAVAGVVALMLEANPILEGRTDLVREILRSTAERFGNASAEDLDPFWNREWGWGLVDAYEAVRLCEDLDAAAINMTDVRHQAHVWEIDVNNETGYVYVNGLAWSRGGTLEGLEYRIDNGDWRSAEIEPGEPYGNFTIRLSGNDVDEGGHNITVRAYGEGMTSLPLSYRFHAPAGMTIPGGEGIGAGVIVVVLLVVGGALFLLMKRRKVQPAETVEG